jgi:hypothetical protein
VADKLFPGDEIPFSARLHNRAVDAADYAAGQRTSQGTPDRQTRARHCLATIRNNTGSARAQWECVAIGDTLLDGCSDARAERAYNGETQQHFDTPIAILQTGIAEGGYGDGQVAGLTRAWVDVQDPDDTRAYPVVGQHSLCSGTSGPHQIVWHPQGTGLLLCDVLLGTCWCEGIGSTPSESSESESSESESSESESSESESSESVPSESESSESESSESESSESESSESESSESVPSESESSESESSESESSESVPSESSESESEPPSESGSESQPPPSESDKSTAIVPAAWSPGGYTALFTSEAPDVRFDDLITATVTDRETWLTIDYRFIDVCEPGTIQVCGCVPDLPVLVGAVVDHDRLRVRLGPRDTDEPVRLVIRLTAIRRGFAGHRFPDRTREQFLANERFLQSAYPGAGR